MNYSDVIKPRFNEIVEEVNLILLNSKNIQSFPFSVTKVIKENTGIVCRNYEKAATYGVDIESFGSDDAIIQKFNGKYIIFYNNSPEIKSERIKFSLGHEFGHKILNHDMDDNKNYDLYEIEANFFSAQLLMPEQVINELRRRGQQITKENLQKWFKVSKMAAEKRMNTLRKIDYTHRSEEDKAMDNYIVNKFRRFIDEIAPITSFLDTYDPYEEESLQNERNSWY